VSGLHIDRIAVTGGDNGQAIADTLVPFTMSQLVGTRSEKSTKAELT